MNVPSGPISSAATAALGRAGFDHAAIPIPTQAFEFIPGQGGEDNARADGVDTCAALAPANGLRRHAQRVATLGDLVGVQGVGGPLGLQHRQRKKRFSRGQRQGLVLLGAERRQAVA